MLATRREITARALEMEIGERSCLPPTISVLVGCGLWADWMLPLAYSVALGQRIGADVVIGCSQPVELAPAPNAERAATTPAPTSAYTHMCVGACAAMDGLVATEQPTIHKSDMQPQTLMPMQRCQ